MRNSRKRKEKNTVFAHYAPVLRKAQQPLPAVIFFLIWQKLRWVPESTLKMNSLFFSFFVNVPMATSVKTLPGNRKHVYAVGGDVSGEICMFLMLLCWQKNLVSFSNKAFRIFSWFLISSFLFENLRYSSAKNRQSWAAKGWAGFALEAPGGEVGS